MRTRKVFCNGVFLHHEYQAGQNPESATGAMATAGEVACPGGEEAFVRAIVRDSLVLKKRVNAIHLLSIYFRVDAIVGIHCYRF